MNMSPRQICLTETTIERNQKKLHEYFSVSYQTRLRKKNLCAYKIFLSRVKEYLCVKRNTSITLNKLHPQVHERQRNRNFDKIQKNLSESFFRLSYGIGVRYNFASDKLQNNLNYGTVEQN